MSASPPWRVDDWELGQDLSKVGQQWDALLRVLDDPALFDTRDPAVSGWSCGQHVGHSVLVARKIAEEIQNNLAEPERNRNESAPDVARLVLSAGSFRRGAAESPPDVHPESRGREHFLALVEPTLDAWTRVTSQADDLAICPARYRHFRLGYLTSAEWVRMCAIHTSHHLRVIRDIECEVSSNGATSEEP